MGLLTAFDADALERIRHAQFDVITRDQALACGISRKAIEHRLRPGGSWQRLLPRVYLTVTGAVSQQHRQVAARLYAGPLSLITGPTAVRLHRLTCPGPDAIDVLVPWTRKRQSVRFVRVHRTRYLPGQCLATRAIRFVHAPRAVADAARMFSAFGDVRAVVSESLLRKACTLEELAAELNAGGLPYTGLFRRALAEVSDGTRSNAEVRFRDLILKSDLERPMFNAQLFDARGRFIAMPDAWWPRAGVAAEIDSHAYHTSVKAQDATNARHDRLVAHGILLLHYPPARLDTDGRGVLSEIRDTIAHGLRRPPLPITALPLAA